MNLNKIVITCPTSTTNTFITIVFINTTRPIFAFVRLTFVDIFIAEFSFETLVTLTNGDFCIEINETTSMRTTKIIVTLIVVKIIRRCYYYFFCLKILICQNWFLPDLRWTLSFTIFTHEFVDAVTFIPTICVLTTTWILKRKAENKDSLGSVERFEK